MATLRVACEGFALGPALRLRLWRESGNPSGCLRGLRPRSSAAASPLELSLRLRREWAPPQAAVEGGRSPPTKAGKRAHLPPSPSLRSGTPSIRLRLWRESETGCLRGLRPRSSAAASPRPRPKRLLRRFQSDVGWLKKGRPGGGRTCRDRRRLLPSRPPASH